MDSETLYFAEFLPRVSAFQIAISSRHSCKLSFTARRICKTSLSQDEKEICSWPAELPDLDPGSCNNFSRPAAGPLQLRFRSRGREVRGLNYENILDPPDLSDAPAKNLVLRCGFCASTVTTPKYCFKRILPLPSNDWCEVAGDAFCHAHQIKSPPQTAHTLTTDHHTSPPPHTIPLLTPHHLTPREGDCLTGESVIRVTGECVRCDTLIIKQGVVKCARCFAPLGKIMGVRDLLAVTTCTVKSFTGNAPLPPYNTTKCENSFLYKVKTFVIHYGEEVESCDIGSLPLELTRSRISLEIPSPPPPSPSTSPSPSLSLPSFTECTLQQKELHLARTLHIAYKNTSSFKFNVQDEHGRVHAHVWMLNVISHMISNTYHMTSRQLTSKFSGVLTSPSPPHPSTSRPALKLLYVVSTATNHTHWSRESAEPLLLTVEECLWLCLLLEQSTLALPPSQRSARDHNVGFLWLDSTEYLM